MNNTNNILNDIYYKICSSSNFGHLFFENNNTYNTYNTYTYRCKICKFDLCIYFNSIQNEVRVSYINKNTYYSLVVIDNCGIYKEIDIPSCDTVIIDNILE